MPLQLIGNTINLRMWLFEKKNNSVSQVRNKYKSFNNGYVFSIHHAQQESQCGQKDVRWTIIENEFEMLHMC